MASSKRIWARGQVVVGLNAAFMVALLFGALANVEEVPIAVIASIGFCGLGLLAFAVGNDSRLVRWRRGDLSGKLVREADGLRRTVLYDGDLGVYQSWYFELRLREEIARCQRYAESMTVLVLKIFPDLAADGVGGWQNEAWRESAAKAAYLTARSVRSVDLTAGLGPMEFGICLIHCDDEGAGVAKRRLVEALAGYRCIVGSAVCPADTQDSKELISMARARALGQAPHSQQAA